MVTQVYTLSGGRWERHDGALKAEPVAGQNLTLHVDTFLLILHICLYGMCLLHPKAQTVWRGNIKYLGIVAPRAARSHCLLELSEYK